MPSWSGSHPPPPRNERSRSPSRSTYGRATYPDPYPPDSYYREWDAYNRDRAWVDYERDRAAYDYGKRGRSRSPQYDDVGRKRRHSMSPYDRERYDPRPRYDDYDPYKVYGHSPRGRGQYGHGHGRPTRVPVNPHTLDYPASLKQYAEWFRYYFPQQAEEEDLADKVAEREANDGSKPRNGIKSRWEKYKKDFLAQQLRTLFEHHKKSPWFAEKYDPSPEYVALRARVRKVGWRGLMSQFIGDLENGKFDKDTDADERDFHESERDEPEESSILAGGLATEEGENPVKPDEDFGMGLDNEEEAADNAGEAKNDANGKVSYDSKSSEKDEVSVLPEGNQVMIRTIPPDIGRVKLEAVLKEYNSFVYLALGDPMQKRNYYRAGWIKFDEHADMQNILSTLGEKKIEGFKLHLNHNTRPFMGKVRFTPEAASRPERIARDLAQARRLAAVLEDEYEHVRTFRPEPPAVQPHGDEGGDQPPPEDILKRDALAEDEPPPEKGCDAVERRITKLTAELHEPSSEAEEKELEVKKNTIALDLYLAYLRAAFHTCYYCVSTSDHIEELQRKCVKHVRKPLSQKAISEKGQQVPADAKSKTEEQDSKMGGEGENVDNGQNEESEEQKRNKEKEDQNKEAMLKEREPKTGEFKESKRSEERWLEWFDGRIALVIDRDGIDVRDYGGRRYEDELSKAVEPHINEEGEGKFRCKTCSKVFKAAAFVEKHVVNKHSELVKQLESLQEMIPYFNNFVLDPQRIQPFTHYPQQGATGPNAPPPQAYGFQNVPQSYPDHRMGMGGPGGPPPYYGYPGPYPPHANGGPDPYAAFPYGYPYPPAAVPQPMRGLRDEQPLAAGNGGGGKRLGDRIGGFAHASALPGHGIEGLPAKPVPTLEPGPGGHRNGAGRGAAPPPPPDAKEDPRAAAGRKVSYHDMDLVAEGDVELNY